MKIKQGVLEIQSIENFQNILQNKEFRWDENDANDAVDENGKNLIRQGWVTFRTIVPGNLITEFNKILPVSKQNKKIYFERKFFMISASLICELNCQ